MTDTRLAAVQDGERKNGLESEVRVSWSRCMDNWRPNTMGMTLVAVRDGLGEKDGVKDWWRMEDRTRRKKLRG